jgi:hypothetical protein
MRNRQIIGRPQGKGVHKICNAHREDMTYGHTPEFYCGQECGVNREENECYCPACAKKWAVASPGGIFYCETRFG